MKKGEVIKYESKISDCSVLKNIWVITEREHWRKGRFGVQVSLHLDILSLKVFGSLKKWFSAQNWQSSRQRLIVVGSAVWANKVEKMT